MLAEWWSNALSIYAEGEYPWKEWLGSRVALAITFPIALVCVGGFTWAVLVWPLWLAFLAGVLLLSLGICATYWAVSKTMPDKRRKLR